MTIVAATDFSDAARAAVDRAVLIEHPLVTEQHLYESAKARLKSLADVLGDHHGAQIPTQGDASGVDRPVRGERSLPRSAAGGSIG